MKTIVYLIIIFCIPLVVWNCKKFTREEQNYIVRIEEQRKLKDKEMQSDPQSPFCSDSSVVFHPLNYYPVDPSFVFHSRLVFQKYPDTIVTYGTKGEERKSIRIGYLPFRYNEVEYKLNVYESWSRKGVHYHALWFTDKTTGKESYGVGRYLDFELNKDSQYVYTIDFNLAYSPYCSYSAKYSCAIPSKEDYIDLAITAGEKKFHPDH
ncbi:MAG: DUF1684 domain-containing protein [Ignavibacteria bacterium]|nr:DUF1684 domain-containing protein [Ignavibacteria bacterium]